MATYPGGLDVEGPVQAEVFVAWLAGDDLELPGPCGPAPWIIELGLSKAMLTASHLAPGDQAEVVIDGVGRD